MSTDRELLELAAKAAGIPVTPDCHIPSGGMWLFHVDVDRVWSPLHDDGDALRLAMKLKIEVAPEVFSKSRVDARSPRGKWLWEMYEDHGDDGQKAARYAILRAAAEIGRSMP